MKQNQKGRAQIEEIWSARCAQAAAEIEKSQIRCMITGHKFFQTDMAYWKEIQKVNKKYAAKSTPKSQTKSQ